MANSPLRQSKGRLSAAEIASGMNAARRNARRLLEDTKILFEAKSFASASMLAILSIEESGKIRYLRTIAAAPESDLGKQWKNFRDHKSKNAHWNILELMAIKRVRTLAGLAPAFDPNSDHQMQLEVLKQLSVYVDCYDNKQWIEPEKLIPEAMPRALIAVAERLVPNRDASEREMQLWSEHLSKTWGTSAMRSSLRDFYRDMIAEGLTKESLPDIEKFIYGEEPR